MTYQDLLNQVVSTDLPALQSAWASIQQLLAFDPANDPCNGVGGPSSLVAPLQQISDQACTVAHNAALAAFGYTFNCGGAGGPNAQAAQDATVQACSLRYAPLGAQLPYGTLMVSGQHQAICLDASFMRAVGMQVAAAQNAVAQAQATAQACASHPTTRMTPPARVLPVRRAVPFTALAPVSRSRRSA